MASFRKEEAWITIDEEWYVLPISKGSSSEDDVTCLIISCLNESLNPPPPRGVFQRGWAYTAPYRLYLIHFKWTPDQPNWTPWEPFIIELCTWSTKGVTFSIIEEWAMWVTVPSGKKVKFVIYLKSSRYNRNINFKNPVYTEFGNLLRWSNLTYLRTPTYKWVFLIICQEEILSGMNP